MQVQRLLDNLFQGNCTHTTALKASSDGCLVSTLVTSENSRKLREIKEEVYACLLSHSRSPCSFPLRPLQLVELLLRPASSPEVLVTGLVRQIMRHHATGGSDSQAGLSAQELAEQLTSHGVQVRSLLNTNLCRLIGAHHMNVGFCPSGRPVPQVVTVFSPPGHIVTLHVSVRPSCLYSRGAVPSW